MPCSDITDVLKIQFDPDGHFLRYTLRKQTCGGEVGRKALITPWLKGKTAEEILAASLADVLTAHKTTSEFREFLIIKHFLAVQAALAVMLGRQAGGPSHFCQIDTIEYDERGTTLSAQIRLDVMTKEIKACNACCRNNQPANDPAEAAPEP